MDFNIDIKYHTDITPIEQKEGSDWVDLKCSENIKLIEGEFKLIPLGVSMKLPEGYEAHIAPRSSTFKNFGIIMANSFGIVDESYCGDNDMWYFPAYATKFTLIQKGERICQFRVVKKQPKINFNIVDSLNNPDRGGFGSTGSN